MLNENFDFKNHVEKCVTWKLTIINKTTTVI